MPAPLIPAIIAAVAKAAPAVAKAAVAIIGAKTVYESTKNNRENKK